MKDYSRSFSTSVSPQDVFKKISRVSQWWAVDFEGKSEKLDDVFTVRFKNGDMYKIKISEIIPNKKIIWDVIDAYQGWHDNHTEWVGTKIVWEVFHQNNGTEVKLTHIGLVPEFECFEKCSMGWDYLMENSLQKLLKDNQGMPR